MMTFLKKNKNILIIAVSIIIVLGIAFFCGDKLTDANNKIKTKEIAPTYNSQTVKTTTTDNEKTETTQKIDNKNAKQTKKVDNIKSTSSNNNAVKNSTEPVEKVTVKNSSKNNSKVSNIKKNNTNKKNTEQTKAVETPKPQSQDKLYCTISISCNNIFNNLDKLKEEKKDYVPKDGWILRPVKVTFNKNDTVFEVLKKVCKDNNIQLEHSYTPIYGSYYIEGIANLYEFDCGNGSGWNYLVNNNTINYGCSKYELHNNDVIEWKYTCNYGKDNGFKF